MTATCENCRGEAEPSPGHGLCNECYSDRYCHCGASGCSTEIDLEWGEFWSRDDGVYCSLACAGLVVCDSCGEEMPREEAYWSDRTSQAYCNECYCERFGFCEGCDGEEVLDRLCGDCYRCEDCCSCSRVILPYDEMPPLRFKGSGPVYAGWELEVEADESTAEALLPEIEDFAYLKEDGSLDRGYEVVSHPGDLDWWRENWSRLDPVWRLKELGGRSYNTETCGFHVHLSKEPISSVCLYKIMRLLYGYPTFTLDLSGRDPSHLDQWARADVGRDDPRYKNKFPLSWAKDKKGWIRYAAVNLTNPFTVEFRFWRGSLDSIAVRAKLEATFGLVEWAKYTLIGGGKLNPKGYLDFMDGFSPEFYRWSREGLLGQKLEHWRD